MQDRDAIQMMQRCSEEIKTLRARIAFLEPRAEAYEVLRTVLGLLPRPSQGYGEDLAWRLDKEIAEIQAKLRAPTKPEQVADPEPAP